MSIDKQACNIWINSACLLQEAFCVASRVQPKAEPVMQYLLWMNGLFECGVAIPLIEQNYIGLGKKSFELTLPFVFR